MNRRSLLLGFGAVLAAPAIVRAESLMKVVAPRRVATFSGMYLDGPSTLDDYEEGKWTPTIEVTDVYAGGSRYATVNGIYTKVGNRVFVHGTFAAKSANPLVILPGNRAAVTHVF